MTPNDRSQCKGRTIERPQRLRRGAPYTRRRLVAATALFGLGAFIVAGLTAHVGSSSSGQAAGPTTVAAPPTTASTTTTTTVPVARTDPLVLGTPLQVGSTGDAVARLQDRLRQLGFEPGPSDGYFGTLTQQAVWAYEKLVAGVPADYTGTYMMTNRVVDNGTPLDDRFDNIARAARRAGYEPALFGYTDQAPDPRVFTDPDDPRLSNWQGVSPGFDPVLELDDNYTPWLSWLTGFGYDVDDVSRALTSESARPVEHSLSAFQTDHLLRWIDRQSGPWFAHASYLRPHPPYNAAGEFATMYDPNDCPDPLPVPARRHPLHDELLADPTTSAPVKPGAVAAARAVLRDDQRGRLPARPGVGVPARTG